MAVQLKTTAPVAFKGSTEKNDKAAAAKKIEDVGQKIDEKVDTFTDGVESIGEGVEKATNSVVKSATGIAGAMALLKGKFSPLINWFYKSVTENPEKPGEFIRENLNKTKVGVVAGIAAAVTAGIAIYKGIQAHNAKKAEQAEAQNEAPKETGENLDITSEAEEAA